MKNFPTISDNMVQVKFVVLNLLMSQLGGFIGLINGIFGFVFGLTLYRFFLKDFAISILRGENSKEQMVYS